MDIINGGKNRNLQCLTPQLARIVLQKFDCNLRGLSVHIKFWPTDNARKNLGHAHLFSARPSLIHLPISRILYILSGVIKKIHSGWTEKI